MSKTVKILETTLRDGSYAVDFSFTPQDTTEFCQALESLGFDLIEVGHGVGLGASEKGVGGKAFASDKDYLAAAKLGVVNSRFGVFCIPGVATLDDLRMTEDFGMGFVRIGTDISKVAESESFIKQAKKQGLYVAANFMKSYAVSPSEFAEQVKRSEGYGADIVYIVDSAGGMFPEDVEKYFNAIRKVSSIDIGFHGHDNLGMAIANSLKAAELGASVVDSSLQGLGRSSGNASTEVLVSALIKRGYNLDVNFFELLKKGHQMLLPFIGNKVEKPLDTIAGFADFHSSYLDKLLRAASSHGVDPAKLIVEMCKIDKQSVSNEDLERVASRMEKEPTLRDYGVSRYVGSEQDDANS